MRFRVFVLFVLFFTFCVFGSANFKSTVKNMDSRITPPMTKRHYDLKFRLNKLQIRIDRMKEYLDLQSSTATHMYKWDKAPPIFNEPPQEGMWNLVPELPVNFGGKQEWVYFRGVLQPLAHWGVDEIELCFGVKENYIDKPVDDNFAAGPEGVVFVDGKMAGALDREHKRIMWNFVPGKKHDVQIVMFTGRCNVNHTLESFEVVWKDVTAQKLFHDLRVALEVVKELSDDSYARLVLSDAIEDATSFLDFRGEKTGSWFSQSVSHAQKAFDDKMSEMTHFAGTSFVRAVGHSHIDLAWMWPMSQTKHKCVRTFATQLNLLNRHDGWVFFQSSPQAYQWVEEYAPQLFEDIKDMVKRGKWEAEGAFWCESDTNVPSGESLVRQLLYGKQYFMEKFGINSKVLWLPDVFGYSAALPQILKLGGVDYFVTSKISWSQYNRFPYDTFRWNGIDGSDVLTHFITTPPFWGTDSTYYTYNSLMNAKEVNGAWNKYRQKSLMLEPLLTFGFGDGGGGPTEEMVQTVKRLSTSSPESFPTIPGFPKLHSDNVMDLLNEISNLTTENLPKWVGELYLEYHRGTYTSQAWIKKANRENEMHLHNYEWIRSLASLLGIPVDPEVSLAVKKCWENLLLLQFHDILPGSSVGETYDEARVIDKEIAKVNDFTDNLEHLVASSMDLSDVKNPVVVFNTLWFDRREIINMPDGSERIVDVPASGWTVLDAAVNSEEPHDSHLWISDDGKAMGNTFWNITFDEDGCISQLRDIENEREVIVNGSPANEFQLFDDHPMNWDAWDIDSFYQDYPLPGPKCESVKVVSPVVEGAVKVSVERRYTLPCEKACNASRIVQTVTIFKHSPLIEFDTEVHWHETRRLLKVAFPVDVHATEANYQIQFGHISRPTHYNTEWDVARFEVSAHRFVDMSEHGYGVSILNDCKYGHDVHDRVMRMTLLKSAMSPNVDADKGTHHFRYALLPHKGMLQEAKVVQFASAFSVPPLVHIPNSSMESPAVNLHEDHDFVFARIIEGSSVVLDTVKPAEKKASTDSTFLTLRFYESHGSRGNATVQFFKKPKNVVLTNLLEESVEDEGIDMILEGNTLRFTLRPFQIATFVAEF